MPQIQAIMLDYRVDYVCTCIYVCKVTVRMA